MAKSGKKAIVRCCASCMWIFRLPSVYTAGDGTEIKDACPKCGFAHYPAIFVFDRAAYHLERTQQPWLERELRKKRAELQQQIDDKNREQDKSRAQKITGLRDPKPRKRKK